MKFHLSVVATTRNDNHGGSLTYRMQKFVDGFVEQCERHELNAELILVEWNPPIDAPPLSQALKFPAEKRRCTVRIITVPPDVHQRMDHADHLPLFQMIGKNVGIQRARGKFVLATNIDILFTDELIRFMRDRLKPGYLYRTDRLDVPHQLPDSENFEDVLRFCHKNYFRVNSKYGTTGVVCTGFLRTVFSVNLFNALCLVFSKILWIIRLIRPRHFITKKLPSKLAQIYRFLIQLFINFKKTKGAISVIKKINKRGCWFLKYSIKFSARFLKEIHQFYLFFCDLFKSFRKPVRLHTNACGDFTLLSYEDWNALRGYPEWEMYSWHIDSVLLYQAYCSGIKETDLDRKMSIFHIEHGIGSGYTPEGADHLFKRLDAQGIRYLSNSELKELVKKMKSTQGPIFYNGESWGLSHLNLEETLI